MEERERGRNLIRKPRSFHNPLILNVYFNLSQNIYNHKILFQMLLFRSIAERKALRATEKKCKCSVYTAHNINRSRRERERTQMFFIESFSILCMCIRKGSIGWRRKRSGSEPYTELHLIQEKNVAQHNSSLCSFCTVGWKVFWCVHVKKHM